MLNIPAKTKIFAAEEALNKEAKETKEAYRKKISASNRILTAGVFCSRKY